MIMEEFMKLLEKIETDQPLSKQEFELYHQYLQENDVQRYMEDRAALEQKLSALPLLLPERSLLDEPASALSNELETFYLLNGMPMSGSTSIANPAVPKKKRTVFAAQWKRLFGAGVAFAAVVAFALMLYPQLEQNEKSAFDAGLTYEMKKQAANEDIALQKQRPSESVTEESATAPATSTLTSPNNTLEVAEQAHTPQQTQPFSVDSSSDAESSVSETSQKRNTSDARPNTYYPPAGGYYPNTFIQPDNNQSTNETDFDAGIENPKDDGKQAGTDELDTQFVVDDSNDTQPIETNNNGGNSGKQDNGVTNGGTAGGGSTSDNSNNKSSGDGLTGQAVTDSQQNYTVTVEDNRVVIRNSAGTVIFTSANGGTQSNQKVVLVGWQMNGQVYRYKLVENSVETLYDIQLATNTEQAVEG